MKTLSAFLGHFGILLIEFVLCCLCGFIAWSLSFSPPKIDRPQPTPTVILKRAINSPAGRIIPTPVPFSTPAPTPTPRLVVFSTPFTERVPAQLAPEKMWGYDRVYSATRLQWFPGFWTVGYPSNSDVMRY